MSGNSNGPTRLSRLLATEQNLSGLLGRARMLGLVQADLRARLPPALAEGWQLARLDAEAMVLIADSPARAATLRYAQNQILAALEKLQQPRPRTLKVKVAAVQRPAPPPPREPLSAAAAEQLRKAAASMEDERLRQALERLARRGRPSRAGE